MQFHEPIFETATFCTFLITFNFTQCNCFEPVTIQFSHFAFCFSQKQKRTLLVRFCLCDFLAVYVVIAMYTVLIFLHYLEDIVQNSKANPAHQEKCYRFGAFRMFFICIVANFEISVSSSVQSKIVFRIIILQTKDRSLKIERFSSY